MVVRCVVTTEGRVHDCRVLKSLPFMDRAVIDALEKRRYKPATLGGRPVEVNYNFKITLRLPE
jgi:protein TonB